MFTEVTFISLRLPSIFLFNWLDKKITILSSHFGYDKTNKL